MRRMRRAPMMRPGLFAHAVSVEARKRLSYRVDFWLSSAGSFAVQVGLAWFVWQAVFDHTEQPTIGGYSFQGMVLYTVMVVLVGQLIRGDMRAATVSTDIYEGSLTRYLLYPTPYLGMKYAENLGRLAPVLLQVVLFGSASALVLDFPTELSISGASLVLGVVSIAIGNLLSFLLLWPLQTVAFWADNVWSLAAMLRFIANLLGGLMLPLTLFPGWAQEALAWLPFQHFFFFPVQTLLGQVPLDQWLQGTAVALGWCSLLYVGGGWLWRRGCAGYTGVGI